MRFQSKTIRQFIIYLLVPCLFACKKFVQVEAPANIIEASQVFSSDKTAIASVLGLYIQMRNQSLSMVNGGLSVYGGLSSDEIVNTSSSSTADPFSKNSLLPTNSTITSNFWSSAYRNIYQCNAILEGLSRSSSLTDSVKKQLTGEVKMIRAFYYFYLIQLFGDVPLALSTDYRINTILGRTSTTDVAGQIVNDLQEAKTLLPVSYSAASKARVNKWAVSALLIRVYLFQKNWTAAEAEASHLITSGAYSLTPNLNNVFLSSSSETIWQIVRDAANTSEGAAFIPSSSSAKPSYMLTANLLNAFEPADQRKSSWTKSNTIGTQTYYYPYKYKVRLSSPVSEYEVVFRLSEVFLARAEARAQQNDLAGAGQDLNTIRIRAGLSPLNLTDKTVLLSAIYHERQVELFCEWGHRWLDLKRWGLADGVFLPLKGQNWQSTDVLYPIPQTEIDRNPSLKQNNGY